MCLNSAIDATVPFDITFYQLIFFFFLLLFCSFSYSQRSSFFGIYSRFSFLLFFLARFTTFFWHLNFSHPLHWAEIFSHFIRFHQTKKKYKHRIFNSFLFLHTSNYKLFHFLFFFFFSLIFFLISYCVLPLLFLLYHYHFFPGCFMKFFFFTFIPDEDFSHV